MRFNALSIVKAHQRPITAIETAGLYLFSSSYDRLIKIFDIRTMKLLHTLVEDDSPVLELKVDEQVDVSSLFIDLIMFILPRLLLFFTTDMNLD